VVGREVQAMTIRRRMGIAAALAVTALPVAVGSEAAASTVTAPRSATTLPSGYIRVDSGYMNLPAGFISGGSVTCPATSSGVARRPQSGGAVVSSSSTAVNISDSYPTPNGWIVDVSNASSTATTFDVWAVCAKPKKAYGQYSSAQIANPPGSDVFGSAACPVGTKVLGGGAQSAQANLHETVNSSWPYKSGSTYYWGVYMNNAGTGDLAFYVYAVCSKYSVSKTGYGIIDGTMVSNPAGTQTEAAVSCPTGQAVSGGGIVVTSSQATVNINTTDPYSDTSWDNFENNASGFGDSLLPIAICAS
jgi:hypothetical protein